MNYIGISAGFHDAAVSVINGQGDVVFAGHNERYSGIKHDKDINSSLVKDALQYVDGDFEVHYYEKPWLKFLRQLRAGERPHFTSLNPKSYLSRGSVKLLENKKFHTHSHHLSHAAAGFQTSTFTDATVVIIDAIGEFDTITIWDARYVNGQAKYKKLYSKTYPDSIGLFYSAMTKYVGLKPLDEEYILMGMAAYGKPIHVSEMSRKLIEDSVNLEFKDNLHIGVPKGLLSDSDNEMDIAASSQSLVESLIRNVMIKAMQLGKSSNLVYGGGVALNCLANRDLGDILIRFGLFLTLVMPVLVSGLVLWAMDDKLTLTIAILAIIFQVLILSMTLLVSYLLSKLWEWHPDEPSSGQEHSETVLCLQILEAARLRRK